MSLINNTQKKTAVSGFHLIDGSSKRIRSDPEGMVASFFNGTK